MRNVQDDVNADGFISWMEFSGPKSSSFTYEDGVDPTGLDGTSDSDTGAGESDDEDVPQIAQDASVDSKEDPGEDEL